MVFTGGAASRCSKTHAKTDNHPSFLRHAYACRYYYGTPTELFILNAFVLKMLRQLSQNHKKITIFAIR
jgi:hypothetical protein